jgi:hypothetical protein
MKQIRFFKLILIVLFSVYHTILSAQCAMCKAGAEQSLELGASDAAWINYGIIFLMCMPFLIIGGIYWMYRRNKSSVEG